MNNNSNFKKMDIENFYKSYVGDIYKYSMFKLRNKEEAEDTTSETFIRLINRGLSNIENPKVWTIGIARNVIYEKYRKEHKNMINADEQVQEIEEQGYDLEKETLDQSMLDTIKEELDKLDEETREIIILKVWEDMKFNEIAEIVNEKESTVKLRYYRGIEKLKLNLNKEKRLKVFTLPLILFGISQIAKNQIYLINSAFASILAGKIGISTNLIINSTKMLGIKSIISTTAGKAVIVAIAGIVSIGGVAGALLITKNNIKDKNTNSETPTSGPVEVPIVDEYEGWQTYVNSELGYKIKYPKEFSVSDGNKNCISIGDGIEQIVLGDDPSPACNRSGWGAGDLRFEDYNLALNNGLNIKGTKYTFYPWIDPRNGILDDTPEEIYYYNKLNSDNLSLRIIQFGFITKDNTENKYMPIFEKILRSLEEAKVNKTFTDAKLPGFSLDYTSDWKVTLKEFGKDDDVGFLSFYFPTCHKSCYGLRLSKGDVRLDLLFDYIYDDNGQACTDTIAFSKLNDKWYRYSLMLEGETVTNLKAIYTAQGKENQESIFKNVGQVYKFCDYGNGATVLRSGPKPEDIFNNYNGNPNEYPSLPGIMIEKPKVYSNSDISSEIIKEIDDIILSIKGI